MIERKPKKCKGQNKANGVSGCGKETMYRKYGLCSTCLTDFYQNDERGKILVRKAYQKALKPRKKAEQGLADAEVDRKKITEIKRLKNLSEKWVHRYVRERDKHLPCISEGTQWSNEHQAGHLYPKGKYEGLRYDLDNIHGQGLHGNIFKEGNVEAYRINLIDRIGKERVDELDNKASYWKRNPKRWEIEELKLIIADAKKRYKALLG